MFRLNKLTIFIVLVVLNTFNLWISHWFEVEYKNTGEVEINNSDIIKNSYTNRETCGDSIFTTLWFDIIKSEDCNWNVSNTWTILDEEVPVWCDKNSLQLVEVTDTNYFLWGKTLSGNTVYRLTEDNYNISWNVISWWFILMNDSCISLIWKSSKSSFINNFDTNITLNDSYWFISSNNWNKILIKNIFGNMKDDTLSHKYSSFIWVYWGSEITMDNVWCEDVQWCIDLQNTTSNILKNSTLWPNIWVWLYMSWTTQTDVLNINIQDAVNWMNIVRNSTNNKFYNMDLSFWNHWLICNNSTITTYNMFWNINIKNYNWYWIYLDGCNWFNFNNININNIGNTWIYWRNTTYYVSNYNISNNTYWIAGNISAMWYFYNWFLYNNSTRWIYHLDWLSKTYMKDLKSFNNTTNISSTPYSNALFFGTIKDSIWDMNTTSWPSVGIFNWNSVGMTNTIESSNSCWEVSLPLISNIYPNTTWWMNCLNSWKQTISLWTIWNYVPWINFWKQKEPLFSGQPLDNTLSSLIMSYDPLKYIGQW